MIFSGHHHQGIPSPDSREKKCGCHTLLICAFQLFTEQITLTCIFSESFPQMMSHSFSHCSRCFLIWIRDIALRENAVWDCRTSTFSGYPGHAKVKTTLFKWKGSWCPSKPCWPSSSVELLSTEGVKKGGEYWDNLFF